MSDAGTPISDEKATLHVAGRTAEFPVHRGTNGAASIDIASFTRQTGLTTLDYGFVNTAATKSSITYIDGDKGILRYRGLPDRAAGPEQHLPRGGVAAHLRRAAHRRRARGVR